MNIIVSQTSLGSGLLFDSVTEEEKIFCGSDLVTYFYTWAYPSSHIVQAVFTLFDLNKGKTTVDFYLRRQDAKSKKALTRFTITANDSMSSYVFNTALSFDFKKSGRYYVVATLAEFKSQIEIPFDVIHRLWPSFTKKEIDFINSNNEKRHSIRVNIVCKTCKRDYIFEENFNKSKTLSTGALEFPKSGKFICKECDNIIELKDIQGRLRYSIKRLINKQMSDYY
jgi:hypothetical protein